MKIPLNMSRFNYYNYTIVVIIILGFTLLKNVAFSQSKKEQIEVLNFRIDSVQQLIQSQKLIKISEVKSLENKNSMTQMTIDSLIIESKTIENLLSSEQKEKKNKELEILKIKNEIEKQNESLKKYIKIKNEGPSNF
jgi:hypothetical protein